MNKYYEILGIKPGTPMAEIKSAYRDLAKVWHPDRFSSDPKLQAKAQEKLKEINEAYNKLRSVEFKQPEISRNQKKETRSSKNTTRPKKPSNHTETEPSYKQPSPSSIPIPPTVIPPPSRNYTWLYAIVGLALLVLFVSIKRAPTELVTSTVKSRSIANPVNSPAPSPNNFVFSPTEPTSPASPLNSTSPSEHRLPPTGIVEHQPTPTVIEILPEPLPEIEARIKPNTNDTIITELSKRLPERPISSKDYFTIGSTKNDVLAVQGTPDRFSDTSFHYGSSTVYFVNGNVTRWEIYYPKLKARLIAAPTTDKSYFTIGSTKDEVINIQGTPDRFTENSFHYGSSTIYFEHNRVTRWEIYYPKLKVKMLPQEP